MWKPSRHAHWLLWVPVVYGLWLVQAVVATMWARRDHPYDLEWMEGGMLGHAWRLTQDLPLYPLPTSEFVPYVYPPGYPAVLAWMEPWVGLDYGPARWVSLVATLVAALLLTGGVWRHGGHLGAGLGAGAMYLACYNSSGAFYDLVRPDALGVALLGSALLLGLERHRWAPAASGLLLAAAWVVKHNFALWGVPLLLAVYARAGLRPALRFVLASAGPALLFTLGLDAANEGRFVDYLVRVPGSHPLVGLRGFPGSVGELGNVMWPGVVGGSAWVIWKGSRQLPVPVLAAIGGVTTFGGLIASAIPKARGVAPAPDWILILTVGALLGALGTGLAHVARTRNRGHASWGWVYGLALVATTLTVGGLMRAHHGGFINVYMPVHWVACLGTGLVAARVWSEGRTWGHAVFAAGLMAAALGWLGTLQDVERLTPTAADVKAGDEMVAALEQCEAPIYSPYAAWLPMQAGKGPSAHLIGVWDVNHPGGPFVSDIRSIDHDAKAKKWGCVVDGGREGLRHGVSAHYRVYRTLRMPPGALTPKTGWRVRPQRILVAKD